MGRIIIAGGRPSASRRRDTVIGPRWRHFVFLTLLLSVEGRAQSLAARLSEYQAVTRVASVAGVSARTCSGVAFHPGTQTLYVIENGNANIYELDTVGVLRRTLSLSGFTDPEGIAYQAGDFFLISEEGLANIVRLKLPRTGSGPVARSSGTVFNIGPNIGNSGIEGVAYRAADRSAFAVKEVDPPRIYRIALDSAGIPLASYPDEPFNIQKKTGDAADIAALEDGNFILVNQEQNRLEGYDSRGTALGSLPLGMAQPEGIAIDAATETIYIIGEPAEFAAFRRKGTSGMRDGHADGGFAVSLPWVGKDRAIRLSLRREEPVRVSLSALPGDWAEVFQGRLGQGSHEIHLGKLPAGVSFCRVIAGSEERSVRIVSF